VNTSGRGPAPRALIWAVPAAVLLHNVEEALTFARYAPTVVALIPGAIRALIPDVEVVYAGLVLAATIPITLAVIARRQGTRGWAVFGLLLVAAVMLVNAVWHVTAALLLRGYAPGVATGVAINVPVMTLALRKSHHDGLLTLGTLLMYLAIGVMLHGAVLIALFAFATFGR
jgi:hypothetical protein